MNPRIVAVLIMAVLAASLLAEDAKPKAEPKPAAEEKDAPKKDVKDMTLDELEAAQICPVTKQPSKPIYHVKVDDKTYHFATRDASNKFKADPAKYGYKKQDAPAGK